MIENDAKEYCMCGIRVDDHGWGDGHTPVSMYDYYTHQQEKETMTQAPWSGASPPPPAVPVHPGEANVLSTQSANRLYERIKQLDESLDEQVEAVKNATRSIAVAHDYIEKIYTQREELAAELDQFAPSQWEPPRQVSMGEAMAAPYSGARPARFRRRHPFA